MFECCRLVVAVIQIKQYVVCTCPYSNQVLCLCVLFKFVIIQISIQANF